MFRLIRPYSSLVKPTLEIKRIIPKKPTFYSGNSDHETNLLELKQLSRKYIDLPLVANKEGKWLTLQQYEPIGGGERLKPSQHKQLVNQLNRLNSIDTQLLPLEVEQILTKYSRSTKLNESDQKIKTLDENGVSKTIGGRKSSTAQVYLVKGDGQVLINNKPLNEYFVELSHREEILYPLKVVEMENDFNIFAKVIGGGPTGQSGAISNALAKSLIIHNPLLKKRLYKAGCMTRDHRVVERKKPGKLKARKSPTWVKR